MASFKDLFSSSDHGTTPVKKPIPPEEDAILEKVAKKVGNHL